MQRKSEELKKGGSKSDHKYTKRRRYNYSSWIIDSSSPINICRDQNCFTKLDISHKAEKYLASGTQISVEGIGDIDLHLTPMDVISLKDVFYVPKMINNILSVNEITNIGYLVVFDQDSCKIYYNGIETNLITTTNKYDGYYKIISPRTGSTEKKKIFKGIEHPKIDENSAMLWHYRLGHIDIKRMMLFSHYKKMVKSSKKEGIQCKICDELKTNYSGDVQCEVKKYAKRILDVVSCDMIRPDEIGLATEELIIIFVDNHSKRMFHYVAQNSEEIDVKFIEFKVQVEEESRLKIRFLKLSSTIDQICSSILNNMETAGVKCEIIPNENREFLRGEKHRIIQTVKCLSKHCVGIPSNLLWKNTLQTSVFLYNRTPLFDNTIPIESWSNTRVNFYDFRIFGSTCRVDNRIFMMIGYCQDGSYIIADSDQPNIYFNSNSSDFLEKELIELIENK